MIKTLSWCGLSLLSVLCLGCGSTIEGGVPEGAPAGKFSSEHPDPGATTNDPMKMIKNANVDPMKPTNDPMKPVGNPIKVR